MLDEEWSQLKSTSWDMPEEPLSQQDVEKTRRTESEVFKLWYGQLD